MRESARLPAKVVKRSRGLGHFGQQQGRRLAAVGHLDIVRISKKACPDLPVRGARVRHALLRQAVVQRRQIGQFQRHRRRRSPQAGGQTDDVGVARMEPAKIRDKVQRQRLFHVLQAPVPPLHHGMTMPGP